MWIEALYSGGVPVLLGILLLVQASRRRKAPDGVDDGKSAAVPARRLLGAALIVIGLLLAFTLLAREQPPPRDRPTQTSSQVAGLSEKGVYRNPYFGLALRYGAEWTDVSDTTRRQFKEMGTGE